MTKKDSQLLEEAYLSISKKVPNIKSDDSKEVTTDPNEVVDVGPMDEPAPGVDMEMIEPQNEPSTDEPVTLSVAAPASEMDGECGCSGGGDGHGWSEEDEEEHQMALDNLNSIRESIMKIASYCGSGQHMEPWIHQKLAIAMDNLSAIARSLR